MAKQTSITNIDRVSLPGKGKGSGKTLEPSDPDKGSGESSAGLPGNTPLPNTKKEQTQAKKKGPGKRTLSPEDMLDREWLKGLEQQVKKAVQGKGAPWNIGGIPPRPGTPGESAPGGGIEGTGNINIGTPAQQIPGGDSRIWVDPSILEKEIDEANNRGEENQRVEDAAAEKEEKTDSVKTAGGKGKGRGAIRDRIAIEKLSQTDWAAIFRTRLTAYSTENAKYLPWNRRFVSNPTLGRKIGSKTPQKDVLPELNLLVDTSSSLSYKEMAVILGEIQKAMDSAKIKTLNVWLWHHQPYKYNSFKDITAKNINRVIEWIQSGWEGGGNDEVALYDDIVKRGKAKKFTISLTDAYLADHMTEGKLKNSWTKALDATNLIFAIVYPNLSIPYSNWVNLGNRMPGTKIPVFLNKLQK